MDGNDLLESVQADEDEGGIQLRRVRLPVRDVVDEKTVQRDRLAVHDVAMVRPRPLAPHHRTTLSTRALPVLSQRRFLHRKSEKLVFIGGTFFELLCQNKNSNLTEF